MGVAVPPSPDDDCLALSWLARVKVPVSYVFLCIMSSTTVVLLATVIEPLPVACAPCRPYYGYFLWRHLLRVQFSSVRFMCSHFFWRPTRPLSTTSFVRPAGAAQRGACAPATVELFEKDSILVEA